MQHPGEVFDGFDDLRARHGGRFVESVNPMFFHRRNAAELLPIGQRAFGRRHSILIQSIDQIDDHVRIEMQNSLGRNDRDSGHSLGSRRFARRRNRSSRCNNRRGRRCTRRPSGREFSSVRCKTSPADACSRPFCGEADRAAIAFRRPFRCPAGSRRKPRRWCGSNRCSPTRFDGKPPACSGPASSSRASIFRARSTAAPSRA